MSPWPRILRHPTVNFRAGVRAPIEIIFWITIVCGGAFKSRVYPVECFRVHDAPAPGATNTSEEEWPSSDFVNRFSRLSSPLRHELSPRLTVSMRLDLQLAWGGSVSEWASSRDWLPDIKYGNYQKSRNYSSVNGQKLTARAAGAQKLLFWLLREQTQSLCRRSLRWLIPNSSSSVQCKNDRVCKTF